MNNMISKLIIFLICILEISAERLAEWDGIAAERNIDGNVFLSLQEKRTGKEIFKEEYFHDFSHGFYTNGTRKYFGITYFSGGESGCCNVLKLFYMKAGELKNLVIENSVYSEPSIIDLDGDKKDEIRTDSELFYSLKLTGRKNTCTITEPAYQGMGKIRFPEYSVIEESSPESRIKEVTFHKKYYEYLKPYFKEAEKFLSENRKKTMNEDNTEIAGILQYLHYKHKIGKGKEAEKNIENADLIIQYSCENDFGKKSDMSEKFNEFIRKNRKFLRIGK